MNTNGKGDVLATAPTFVPVRTTEAPPWRVEVYAPDVLPVDAVPADELRREQEASS